MEPGASHAAPHPDHFRAIYEALPAEPDSAWLQLQVRDSGCGIALQEQALIFMPFFSRRADGQRGTGLGLAISKATMERFGGSIEVASTPGQGSVFTLTLQRVAPAPPRPDNGGNAPRRGLKVLP